MATSEVTVQPTTSWDEAESIAALARLEDLQGLIDDLRLTIDRVMQPLSTPQKDVIAAWSMYKQAIVGSQGNIKTLRTQWNSPEIQSIFEHGKQSVKANPDLSASAEVPQYGWKQAQRARPKAVLPKKRRHSLIEDEPVIFDEGELGSIVERFRSKYPQIKIETKEKDHDLMVQLVTAGTRLKFHIIVGQGTNGRGKLSAKGLATTKLQTAISQCIASRPRTNDLQYLLDMIAAYKTVNAAVCAKCNKLHDSSGQGPVARRSKETSNGDSPPSIIWEAFHAGCVD